MTKEETKKAAEIMLRWSEGFEVQTQHKESAGWINIREPAWNWKDYDYRIKPEPMEIEVWVKAGIGVPIPTNSAYAEPAFTMEQKGWTRKKFREVTE